MTIISLPNFFHFRLANLSDTSLSTHYAVLALSQAASAAQIRAAYLTLILAHHPDKRPIGAATSARHAAGMEQDGAVTAEALNQAYAVLGDQDSRREYDVQLARGELLSFVNVPRASSDCCG